MANAIFHAHGPVVVTQTNDMYLGAQRLSNNTGEMTAVIEALLWILMKHRFGQTHLDLLSKPLLIITDSAYVLGLFNGTLLPRENFLIASLLKHLFDLVRSLVTLGIRWTRGHSGNEGNEIADMLAGMGRRPEAEIYARPFIDQWGEEDFRKKIIGTGFKTAHYPSVGRAAKRCNNRRGGGGVIDLIEPTDISSRIAYWRNDEKVLSLSEFTKSVADISKECGVPRKRAGCRLADDDELVVHHQALVSQRSICRCSLTRARLSLDICRSRRKIRTKKVEMEAIAAAKYGRAPRNPQKPPRIYALKDNVDAAIIYDDPDDLHKHVYDFFHNLFTVPDDAHDFVPLWIYNDFRYDDLDSLGYFDGATLNTLLLEMPLGKTGTEDCIVCEILRGFGCRHLGPPCRQF